MATTNHWNSNAEDTLANQHPPVSKIDLLDLETSIIDWSQYQPKQKPVLREKKKPREHQETAIGNVLAGFKTHNRGRLIMACGTGKTFTSLKLAEQLVGPGGRVLFLVPSLSLLSQSLTEWTQESQVPLHSFAVCSDSDVGKKKASNDDEIKVKVHELRYPATTNPERLATEYQKRHDATHMTVVFSTYHSIDVISQAQKEYGFPEFDLIVCDEAHRTTGVTFGGEENDSAFVKVHNQDYLHGKRRLYMTATPRIYGDVAQEKAEKEGAIVYGMNNAEIFGPEFHVITFSEAVRRKLLVDYKVIVLAVDEGTVSARLQKLLDDPDNGLKVDDASKIVGCWKALAKIGLSQDGVEDPEPMKRAVAFCQVISPDYKGRAHKVSSIQIAEMFQKVVEEYQQQDGIEPEARLTCEAEHVDGGMNASEKEGKLSWLKEETPDKTCRVLSNVRCLSEGVDVPALDAVLFLTPRNSQVDVVQSVGRVMRNAPGKKRGYVVLPVVIPAGTPPEQSLDNNQAYKVVWQVLQALRSHDDRFDNMVNKMDLQAKPDTSRMEVVAITQKITQKTMALTTGTAQKAHSSYSLGKKASRPSEDQFKMEFEVGEIERAIYAKIVKKVGNRHHWEDWAGDIAKIAQTHITRITTILENPENVGARKAFDQFAGDLRSELNDSITDEEIIEMLAQHLITRPVFEALFSGHSFVSDNPMSKAMQSVLDALDKHSLHKEADTLEAFYANVRERASGIDTAYGRQKVIKELYDGFFQTAFPKLKERLGIVYTPLEVVDFIIRSINDVLENEFGQTLGSKGVHIMDPFTGTGTFITRLLQSGLITKEQLRHKYKQELHANEIVLLAYYIASINIEATFSDLMDGAYEPFEGICLTDTFRLSEPHDLIGSTLEDNNKRIRKQKKLDIRVIMGNPPYSVGQESGNDNNQNVSYPALDERIAKTYAERSTATNKRALYDSYIRAIRWASDRIGNCGVLGFVTNAGFLDANTANGLRQCLAEEFSSIHVFHLRGNQRTSGETSRKEGGKIFDAGSRAPIAISIMVKNPDAKEQGRILFHDIGDYLTREQKLKHIEALASVNGLTDAGLWQNITPDEHGDWLRQRDDNFGQFIAIGSKDKDAGTVLFSTYSAGVKTQRDAWCWNAGKKALANNMQTTISAYNQELMRFNEAFPVLHRQTRDKEVDKFIDTNPTKISWTRALKQDLVKGKDLLYSSNCLVKGVYRPFTFQWLYFNRRMNEMVYQMPRLFPDAKADNRIIMIKQRQPDDSQFVLMSKHVPDLQSDGGTQCFSEYLYEEDRTGQDRTGQDRTGQDRTGQDRTGQDRTGQDRTGQDRTGQDRTGQDRTGQDRTGQDRTGQLYSLTNRSTREKSCNLHIRSRGEPTILDNDDVLHSRPSSFARRSMFSDVSLRNGGKIMNTSQGSLFEQTPSQPRLVQREAITDEGLKHFQDAYPGQVITKQDLFYYVYGLLHSLEYRKRYADTLRKELPRIPRVKTYEAFKAFSDAGRRLGEMHVNFDSQPIYEGVKVDYGKGPLTPETFRVEKMKYGKGKDKSILHYNDRITVTGIPLEAYDYVVNGKSALDWVVERQCVKTDKASGIVNDANDWAIETMDNPRYPLELFLRVITISLETMKIVNGLPPLDIFYN
ncbi:DNA helicase restriction enzyme Type III R subunit [Acetobacter pasteurianus IFO 3283-01-42C]|uniref:DNA helicase restriction enzyme Type III R subunit n=3 Tax=Acetobacter pasteurianus TaxID=438 RepID=C7JCH1_ACEP3|nr:DNA helicase restriction enzyme Type III R subunit [Acetobacter pasteurianus IFO 3283-01]BAI06098.1 DNA helicase restriction enzyme Type III R subunit [Acetobacter pasteurianus IFO 3283-07]BAI12196.1 DNA helicase restriction enzyme Type III R subunit [Acetobacter pasteurianus IFO 3283-26]BAI18221.1 DNA helicase restriction enzyme Type III R subunit [Acetobacter pasteurianus IFO 3283-01-42C]